ncbi:hypothetical protein EYS09_15050 [Streptomyces kasugaensis]|uniref:Uncharacterized protein n=1 Tax=Streptomyces kasugaensis TaxID=1946 RepID=A0A4Q9HVH1_STRKA|nr:hypothetical protein [Streptomyces kasugaensis]TBO58895.1 hypothetical protein EYS09_15050 [Streptomyces kasugaensis]
MPTYEALPRFTADLDRLTPEQRCRFRRAVNAFVGDLRTGRFRAGLRVKRIRCTPGVFELTWDGNGRATWQYGPEIVRGAPHIVWRRVGGHDIFSGP